MPEIKISDIFKLVGKVIQFLIGAAGVVIQFLIGAAGVVIIFLLIVTGIKKFIEYSDERGDRKAICAERIETVENEVAAKKLFETCMDR
jgi:hypothetical protein